MNRYALTLERPAETHRKINGQGREVIAPTRSAGPRVHDFTVDPHSVLLDARNPSQGGGTMKLLTVLTVGVLGGLLAQTSDAQIRGEFERQERLRPGTFFLTSEDDERELVRYSEPRDLRLCLDAADEGEALPIEVAWDNDAEDRQTAILHPGNCLHIDAAQVSVSPTEDLPEGHVFQGSIDVDPRPSG